MADWEGIADPMKEDGVVIDPGVRSLAAATSNEACMEFGLCEEGCIVGMLVLHGLDVVSPQGFVELTYWELLDS